MDKESKPTTGSSGKKGRPPKLSAEAQAALRNLALANPHMSVDDLTLLFAKRHEIKITGNTARSYLKKAPVIQRDTSCPRMTGFRLGGGAKGGGAIEVA